MLNSFVKFHTKNLYALPIYRQKSKGCYFFYSPCTWLYVVREGTAAMLPGSSWVLYSNCPRRERTNPDSLCCISSPR